MKTQSLIIIIALSLLLTSCDNSRMAWVKPGSGQNEFASDKYRCLTDSQQRVVESHTDANFHYDDKVITNPELFNACMNAQGWRFTRIGNQQQKASQNGNARAALPQVTNTSSSACTTAWNSLVDANQVDNVKKLVQNDCNRIHKLGWKSGQGISNPALCSPPWDSLERANMLEQAKTLVKLDCAVMHKNGF